MEKRKPHYPLGRIKRLIQQGDYRVTRTALQCGIRDFGFVETPRVAESILTMEPKDFYKSMTAIHDSRLWQDVYRPTVAGTRAYVKVQIVDETTVVISFKALEDGYDA